MDPEETPLEREQREEREARDERYYQAVADANGSSDGTRGPNGERYRDPSAAARASAMREGGPLGDRAAQDARRRSGASDTDRRLAGIPLIGSIWGGGVEAADARAEADINRDYWEGLNATAPTREELTADREDYTFDGADPSAWATEAGEAATGRVAMSDALNQMRGWAEGGLTDTDRAGMDEVSRRGAMDARGDREAALAAMEARGMGGSGSALASTMAGAEGAASRNSSANTGMLAAAQQRQFEATRAAADIAGGMRSASDRRTGALEDYGNRETDYRRDLGRRNTDTHHANSEDWADSAQDVYDNRERAVAGATNQYSTDASGRESRADRDRRDEESERGFIGGILESL